MKALFAFAFSFAICLALVAQPTRIAIIDFENISGIAKYDGLGKAMSSMLISDIEANVSPKRLQLVERAQIQKVIKEQNFQASGSVDKATTVKAGKILGVTYMLVGDVYVLNEQLIINARLTNTETGDIVFSKKQEGKTTAWLPLKTAIAQDIASSLAMPFTEPTIHDSELAIGTVTTFGNAIKAIDQGDIELSESLLDAVSDFSPNFKYTDEIRMELNELKKRVNKLEEDIEITTTDPFSAALNFDKQNKFADAEKYYLIGLNRNQECDLGSYLDYNYALSELYLRNLYYEKAIIHCDSILNIYPYLDDAIKIKMTSLLNLNSNSEFLDWAAEISNNIQGSKSMRTFNECLLNYTKIKKIECNEFGLLTLTYDSGFSIETSRYKFSQGINGVMVDLLQKQNELKRATKAMATTPPLPVGKTDIRAFRDYPSGQNCQEKNCNGFVFIESGEKYSGPCKLCKEIYFANIPYDLRQSDSYPILVDSNSYSQGNLRLLSKRITELNAIGTLNSTFVEYLNIYAQEGWNSILSKNYKRASDLFIQCLYVTAKQEIQNRTRSVVEWTTFERDFLNIGIDNEITLKSDFLNDWILGELLEEGGRFSKYELLKLNEDIINLYINYIHTLFLDNQCEKAIKNYMSLDLNQNIKTMDMKIINIIKNDFKEFKNNGLINESEITKLMKSLDKQ
jgi:TolB-like protein